MNHPYELLADLVDGTLDEGNLAGVQAHLEACTACRNDVAHATAGREAARALPQATAPPDLHQRVVAAAGGRGHGAPTWYRWAGVAAAAAVVAAIAIALPNVGADEDRAGVRGTFGAAEQSGAAAEDSVAGGHRIVVEQLPTDFDEMALQRLAKDSATRLQRPSGQSPQAATLASDAVAVRCVTDAWGGNISGELARVIHARFQGQDAYLAVYLEGPGADEPADTAFVYVASRPTCRALSTAFAHR